MIICTSCGTQNEDGESFCGECGAYLEWEGERVGPAAEPEIVPEPAPPTPEATPGLVARIKTAVGIGSDDDAAAPPAAARGEAVAAAAAPHEVDAEQRAADQAEAAAPAATVVAEPREAAALVVPVGSQPAAAAVAPATVPPGGAPPTAPGPSVPGPAAVRPGQAAPKPRRRQLPPDERPPQPGEIICGECGAGNAATRKFCRRCGNDLADAPVVPQPSWWRRLFRRRARAAPVVGTRNETKVRRFRLTRPAAFAVVIVVLAVLGYVGRSHVSGAYNAVLDRVLGTKPVNPTSFTASSSAPGHPARFVRDGAPNRYWAPRAAAPARSQWVQVGFGASVRLVYVSVFNGASDQLADYLKQASPDQLRITVLRKGHSPTRKTVTLEDKPGTQRFHIAVSGATGVRLTIESAYRAAAGKQVAIGEVEFLARK